MDQKDASQKCGRAVEWSVGDCPMKQIENPMVVDSLWNDWVSNTEPDGYYDRHSEEFVTKDNALDYALEKLDFDDYTKGRFIEDAIDLIVDNEEVKEAFLKWFYKNWERSGDV